MTGRRARPGLWTALAAACACLLLPVGAMVARSFVLEEVVTTDGQVYEAAGDVRVLQDRVEFSIQGAPGEARTPQILRRDQVREVRERLSLRHYAFVLGDPRARALVVNSLHLALGAAVAALVLGLPLAFLLWRTAMPGRRVLFALDVGCLVLPPFLVALGAARPLGTWLHRTLGLTGETLQLANAWVLFGLVLHPVVVLLVGRALAAVPAGPHEAARLLRGRGAALRHVTLPAVLPAVAGSAVLVFAIALTDFGVPDLLSFLLPPTGEAVQVFAREIQVQWATEGNHARAVATGAPLTLLSLGLLAASVPLLARSPALAAATGPRRPRLRLPPLAAAGAVVSVLLVLLVALGLPLGGILSWGLGHGDTVAQGGGGGAPGTSGPGAGRLGDFAGSLRNTPGVVDDWGRWLRTALLAALAATLLAVPLARWAVRGGRLARAVVLGLGALSLSVPGLVIGVGTVIATRDLRLPGLDDATLRAASALTARFLAFALLPVWLALREVPVGLEEAGATLGAGPGERGRRIWWPLARPGVLAAAVLVFLLALREIDAIVLIQPQVFPLRLYDKIHYSRLADEANLAFFYVGHLLVPALLLAVLLARRARRQHPSEER